MTHLHIPAFSAPILRDKTRGVYVGEQTKYTQPYQDCFFDSGNVLALRNNNFGEFLANKDVALVLFYDKSIPLSRVMQKMVSQAECSTQRANHAYCGVDCVENGALCRTNGVTEYPAVKIYSRGHSVIQMKTLSTVTADMLRQCVEMAPIVNKPRLTACTTIHRKEY